MEIKISLMDRNRQLKQKKEPEIANSSNAREMKEDEKIG